MTLIDLLASLLPILGPGNDGKVQRQVNVQVTPIVNAQKHVTVTVSPVINVNISIAVGTRASASVRPESKKQLKQRKTRPDAPSPKRNGEPPRKTSDSS